MECDHTGVPELRAGEPRKGKRKSGKKWERKGKRKEKDTWEKNST
jgi:hypothetical protein